MRHAQSDADLEARTVRLDFEPTALLSLICEARITLGIREEIEARATAAQKQMQHLALRDHGGEAQCHGRGACGLIP